MAAWWQQSSVADRRYQAAEGVSRSSFLARASAGLQVQVNKRVVISLTEVSVPESR